MQSQTKFCRHCDLIIHSDVVTKKASEMPFLTKKEISESPEDLFFCDKNCYFNFATSRAKKDEEGELDEVKTLEELAEWQVWSLTQLYSVDFSQSGIGAKKCVFNKRTIKVCVRWC